MIKAFFPERFFGMARFQGQSSANMEELYENDKCQYVFEGDYCMAQWFYLVYQ